MKDRIIYNKFINVIIIKFTKTIIIDDIHFFYLTNIIYKPKILDTQLGKTFHATAKYIKLLIIWNCLMMIILRGFGPEGN